MKRFCLKYVFLLPIIMLLGTACTCYFDVITNEYDYVIAGNSFGYSIISNIALFILFRYNGKFCWHTKTIPLFLIIINITDILAWLYLSDVHYLKIFQFLCCYGIVFSILYLDFLRKIKNKIITLFLYMLLTTVSIKLIYTLFN